MKKMLQSICGSEMLTVLTHMICWGLVKITAVALNRGPWPELGFVHRRFMRYMKKSMQKCVKR